MFFSLISIFRRYYGDRNNLPGIDGEVRSGDRLDSYFDPFLAKAVRALFWFLLPRDGSSSSRNWNFLY